MRKLPAHYPSLIPTSLLPSSRPHPTPRLPFYPSHLVHFSFPIFLVSDAWPLLACELCSLLYLSLFCFIQHLLFSICLIIFHLRACCPETLGSPPLGIRPLRAVSTIRNGLEHSKLLWPTVVCRVRPLHTWDMQKSEKHVVRPLKLPWPSYVSNIHTILICQFVKVNSAVDYIVQYLFSLFLLMQ